MEANKQTRTLRRYYTHLQRRHGKGVGTDLVGQKDRGGNRSVSIAVGFHHDNDGTHLAVGRTFYLGIVVREGRQSDLVDGPVICRVHHMHNTLLLGQPMLRGVNTPGPYDDVADGRRKIGVAAGAIIGRHGQLIGNVQLAMFNVQLNRQCSIESAMFN
jgi:hypothetical protein